MAALASRIPFFRLSRLSSSAITSRFMSNQTHANAGQPRNDKTIYDGKIHAQQEFKKVQKGLYTIPNMMTLSRIATTPAIGYFIWNGMHSQALTCFAFAALTDLLDGFIARKYNQSSAIGAILDPVADKVLLTTCFVSLLHVDLMPFYLVKGFIFRDVSILIGAAIVRYFGFNQPPTFKQFFDFTGQPTLGLEPNFTSKLNTALQCLLIVVHLGTNHMAGNFYYDLAISGLNFSLITTTTLSFSMYLYRFFDSDFLQRGPRLKF